MKSWLTSTGPEPAIPAIGESRGSTGPEIATGAERCTGGAVSRSQRVFVLGVAVFLGLTGGVNLVSVLGESRVLGAADPLVPWLTVRQMLFLAAALELGVAAVLWRHRQARWAPWLILWLVAMFGTYRLGLWAIGFQGHCGCLGHLFDRLPQFEVWADRVLLASLFVMGTGVIICLCMYSLIPKISTVSRCKRHKKRATTFGTMHLTPLFIITAILFPELCFSAQHFAVGGTCRWKHFNETGNCLYEESAIFNISVDGCLFDMVIKVQGSPEDYRRVVGDSHTTYYIRDYRTAVEETKASGREVGQNIAGGTALKHSVPNLFTYSHAGVIWLTYASACYFDQLTPSRLGSISASGELDVASGLGTDSGADVAMFRAKRPATWSLLQANGLPERIIYYETGYEKSMPGANARYVARRLKFPYSNGFTNSIYTVLHTTNYNGLLLPLEASYVTYWVKGSGITSNDLWIRYAFEIRSTNLAAENKPLMIPPMLPGTTLITEARFVEDTTHPISTFSYFATNRFPNENDVRNSAAYAKAKPQAKLSVFIPRSREIFSMLLLLCLLAPPLCILCIRLIKRSNQNRRNNQ